MASSSNSNRRNTKVSPIHLLLQAAVILALIEIGATPAAAASAAPPTIPDSEFDVVMVQWLHRHGARSPTPPANDSLICGNYSCGELTAVGAAQMKSLGTSLSDRYRHNAWWPPYYSPKWIYSIAAQVPRCIQSSNGVIYGLWNGNLTHYYPAVENTDFTYDDLLLIEAKPSWGTWLDAWEYEALHNMTFLVDGNFSDETVATMASEAHLAGYCAEKYVFKALCVQTLEDIATGFRSLGTLPQYPTLADNMLKLDKFLEEYNSRTYFYYPQRELDQQRGSPGNILAQTMVSNFGKFLHGSASTEGVKAVNQTPTDTVVLYHYSAHDTSLMPLASTFGIQENYKHIQFGGVFVIELLRGTTTGQAYVRVYYAQPPEEPTPNGQYPYSWTQTNLRGIRASNGPQTLPSNETYATNTQPIPLADFVTFINSSVARNDLGICYLDEATLKELACYGETIPKAPPGENSYDPGDCTTFRSVCSGNACPSGYYMTNYTTSECSKIPKGTGMTPANVGGMAVGTSLGGMLIGAVLMYLLSLRIPMRPQAAAAATVSNEPY